MHYPKIKQKTYNTSKILAPPLKFSLLTILRLVQIIGEEAIKFELNDNADEYFGDLFNKCEQAKHETILVDKYLR